MKICCELEFAGGCEILNMHSYLSHTVCLSLRLSHLRECVIDSVRACVHLAFFF